MLRENEHFRVINSLFPNIGKRLMALLGQPEFSIYINKLLSDARDGARTGFPEDVSVALFELMQQHDHEYPRCDVEEADVWNQNNETL